MDPLPALAGCSPGGTGYSRLWCRSPTAWATTSASTISARIRDAFAGLRPQLTGLISEMLGGGNGGSSASQREYRSGSAAPRSVRGCGKWNTQSRWSEPTGSISSNTKQGRSLFGRPTRKSETKPFSPRSDTSTSLRLIPSADSKVEVHRLFREGRTVQESQIPCREEL